MCCRRIGGVRRGSCVFAVKRGHGRESTLRNGEGGSSVRRTSGWAEQVCVQCAADGREKLE